MTRRLVEIDTLAAFDAQLRTDTRLSGWFVQSLDLADRSAELADRDPQGAVFLGCTFAPGTEDQLRQRGALVFPRLPDLPFNPYRATLYDAGELYEGSQHGAWCHEGSVDAAIYAWSRTPAAPSLDHALATTLHDHAITDALDDATDGLDPRHLVGVMGGHALQRGEPAYAAAAELGTRLARAGRTVLTGGGPGAMEAANLGAYLSTGGAAALPAAVEMLTAAAGYRAGLEPWLRAAFAVRQRWPVEQAGRSLSIPTWRYGHEPTNVFATGIAKYFANSVREDTLLHRCLGGIVYLPGQAGTVQEIFQAATDSFYATDAARIAPLVLVGVDYWTATYPAWPLLQRLAAGRPMSSAVCCVDSVAAAAAVLLGTV